MAAKYRIMYLEPKDSGADYEAVIGKVSFSKTGRTLYYRDSVYGDLEFVSLKGVGWKVNYCDQNGRHWWISGCRKDGNDGLYKVKVLVDEDIRAEYWTQIRELPERSNQESFISAGKNGGKPDMKNKTGNV